MSHQDEAHAASYDTGFLQNPHRALVWRLEQRALDDILIRYFGDRRIQVLDFASGTGRIAAFLESRGASGVCVDLSAPMLAHARGKVCRFELIEADLTRYDVLGRRRFDLITAFRFFPNAEPELRSEAIRAIVRHMAPGGYLVFNNHLNRSSLQQRLLRLFRRPNARFRMSQEEVDRLLREGRLRVVRVYPIALFPATENHLLLPAPVLAVFERTASKLGRFKNLFQDLVFVCRREVPGS